MAVSVIHPKTSTMPLPITPTDETPMLARLRGRRLPVVAVGAASLLVGCYNFLPVPADATTPGAEVRVVLTDAGSVAMTSIAGPRIAMLDGRVGRAGSDSVVLLVRRATNMRGEETAWAGERLAIPASIIASVQQKRLNGTRSALALLAGAGLLAGAILAAGSAGGGEPPVTGGPPPSGQ